MTPTSALGQTRGAAFPLRVAFRRTPRSSNVDRTNKDSRTGFPGGKELISCASYTLLLFLVAGGALAQRLELSTLTPEERQSIEAVCLSAKVLEGPAAYTRCVRSQISLLNSGPRRPQLDDLAAEEKQSIESVCLSEKVLEGPAAYNRCLQTQLHQLRQGPRRPDLSHLSADERQSIESVCLSDKVLTGPAAYNACLNRQLLMLDEPTEAAPIVEKHNFPPRISPNSPIASHRPTQPAFTWPAWRSGAPGKPPASHREVPMEPSELFKLASPSIYVVLAAPSREHLVRRERVTQGSAVAVSSSTLLTNCHVLTGRPFVVLVQGSATAEARIERADPSTDRCILTTQSATLNPVGGVRSWETLTVGERVYTIGAPSGLEQTLGEGLVSGLRRVDGTRIVQTTAPISPGSSGGGLFDSVGRLVGITTFLLKETQALNFAIVASTYWDE